MTKYIFIILSLFIHTYSYAQNNHDYEDAIEKDIKSFKGAERVVQLLQHTYTYFDQDQQMGYYAAKKLIKESSILKDSVLKSQAYNTMGVLLQRMGSFDSALVYYTQSVALNNDLNETSKTFNNMGVVYREISDYDNSLKYHKEAYKIYETLGDKKGVAYSLNNIGNTYLKQGTYSMAYDYYLQSLSIRKELGVIADIAASYNNIGNVYIQMNNYEKALNNLMEALNLFKEANDIKAIAYTLNGIGNFYLQLKIYDKAREYYSESLELRKKLGDKSEIAGSLNNIGIVHRDLQNYDIALNYYTQALQLRQEIGNPNGIAIALNSIGGLYWKKREFTKATEYYLQVLEIRLKIGNKSNIASSYKNLGIIYKERSDYERALYYYQKSLNEYVDIGNNRGIASIQNLKGNVFRELKEYDKAIEYYKNSLALYELEKNYQTLSYIENNIGEVYAERSDYKKSINHFLNAVDYANKSLDKGAKEIAFHNLSSIYIELKDFEKSLEFYKKYVGIKDSISNDMNRRRIAEIEFESAIKTKETEISKQELQLIDKEAKIEKQKQFITIAIIFIIIIIVFSFSIYYQYKQKIKANILIEEKTRLLEIAYQKLETTNNELEIKNLKITDSINYAKRIQRAVLPSEDLIKKYFPQSFIYYKPKEIVSGDFYWLYDSGESIYVATVDCTGHGVPGAFMSMIGNILLNEIVINAKVTDTAEILQKLDMGVIKALKQDVDSDLRQEDGMDLSLVCINKKLQTIEFAGANHKMFIFDSNTINSIDGDIYSIGGMYKIKQRKNAHYTKQIINFNVGATLYMFTDGYLDQFGGDSNEKFMSKRFIELLTQNQEYNMHEQYLAISQAFEKWKGNEPQLDDVTIVGIRLD